MTELTQSQGDTIRGATEAGHEVVVDKNCHCDVESDSDWDVVFDDPKRDDAGVLTYRGRFLVDGELKDSERVYWTEVEKLAAGFDWTVRKNN
jgi:hypothetical protein